ncbi:MAG: ABC transporter ATP-binding protein [Candidatus Cloacimonetes bacterium]|nr:ABC transporter ATP-binding protein [Candidatus Cloacimonadota bacterium]
MIEARNLEKIYKTRVERIQALKGLNFSVEKGDFTALMGPSGAGKTTLLNLIGCLDTSTAGELLMDGRQLDHLKEKELTEIRRNFVGMVFQEFFLIETLSALENVMLPALFNPGKKIQKERGAYLMELVGLKNRMQHLPRELSGGEMQRVAIARALMNSPRIILADEPTGNLDRKNALNIFAILAEINHTEDVTVLVATHNVKLAHQAKNIMYISDGLIIKEEAVR